MTGEELIANNRLIADFMGEKTTFRNKELAIYCLPDAAYPEYFRVTKFNRYQEDWNMLMPVIEKIESLGYETSIQNGMCHFWHGKYPSIELQFSTKSNNSIIPKIQLCYETVVGFIKWYTTTEAYRLKAQEGEK